MESSSAEINYLKRFAKWSLILVSLSAILLLSMGVATAVGPMAIPVDKALSIILHQVPLLDNFIPVQWTSVEESVIVQLRLPRVLSAAVVGVALAMAGVAFQCLFRNPMADPYVLGVASGGIDTSIIAFEASKHKRITAITVGFELGSAKDLEFAKIMAGFLGIPHKIRIFNAEEMVEAVNGVIAVLKVFDPMEVRNSVPVYVGLRFAKAMGINSVMTGDALYELILGYPWLFHLPEEELKQRLWKMWEEMLFSSTPLGEAAGVRVKTPFLDEEFVEFAKKIDIKLKLNVKDGEKYGKWLIRKAYENLIPNEIIWRSKAPLEIGTGTTVLPKLFDEQMKEKYFEEKKRLYMKEDGVKLSTKEQLFYYEIFREHREKPSEVYNVKKGKQCPNCKAFLRKETNFCRICGAYPI